jgi:ribosomal protein S24E
VERCKAKYQDNYFVSFKIIISRITALMDRKLKMMVSNKINGYIGQGRNQVEVVIWEKPNHNLLKLNTNASKF